jgi:hydroxypyruvate isomerase
MRISVCTDMLYSKMPTHEAMALIKDAGADGVEFWGTQGKDIAAIAAASADLDLPVAIFCGPMSPPLVEAGAGERFAQGLAALDGPCQMLGCRKLIAVSGKPVASLSPQQMLDNMARNLEHALPMLDRYDMHLMLEPINAGEGQFMQFTWQALHLLRSLDSGRLKLLMDLYHAQLMEGNLIDTIRQNVDVIGHFHAADVPGRTAPGEGEINFINVAAAIDATGYDGYMGLEYKPGQDRDSDLAEVISMLQT